MSHPRTRVQRALTFHPELWERVRRHALLNNRTNVSVVEQALAEHLAIPLADPDLPEQPVELCPRCEKGVLWQGKCPVCSWRRVERPHWRKNHPPTLPTRAPEN